MDKDEFKRLVTAISGICELELSTGVVSRLIWPDKASDSVDVDKKS